MNTLIWTSVVLASAVMPAYLLYYRWRVMPLRREQIRVLLTRHVAESYCEVFAPGPGGEDVSPGALIEKRFDQAHAPAGYLWTGILAWLPSVVGILVTALWARDRLEGSDGLSGQIPTTVVMAFVGGYVWSLYEIFERGGRGDLLPRGLADVAYRVLASVPIGYAFSLVVVEDAAAFGAFAASSFPMRDVRLMARTWMLRQLDRSPSSASIQREALLGRHVQGLSAKNLARLREIEISTVVDLALADPIQVMVTTGLPLRSLVDWMDQSLLAMYVGDKMDRLAPMGIRGALEASHLFEETCGAWDEADDELWVLDEEAETAEAIVEFAEVLEVSPELAIRLLWEIDEDPHLAFLSTLWGEWSGREEGEAEAVEVQE